MSRSLDPLLATELSAASIAPIIMVMLTFRSQTYYCWSGVGTLVYNGQNYLGVGSLGTISSINEGVEVKADGMSVTLSGIDPLLMAECMTDIQVGAPAKVWLGMLQNGALYGAPYQIFSGQVDKPTFNIGTQELSISLALENKMINHARPNMRRYTSADQRLYYPTDSSMTWVEQLCDAAWDWGY